MIHNSSLQALRLRKITLLLASAVLLSACGSLKTPQSTTGEKIGTVQQLYDGALISDVQVSTYRNIDKLYLTRVVKRGDTVYPLPRSDKPLKNVGFTSGGKKFDLVDYMAINRVRRLSM
jgi:hypothetical protein